MTPQRLCLTLALEGPATIGLSNDDGWICLERHYAEKGSTDLAPVFRYSVMVEIDSTYSLAYWTERIVSGLEKTGFRLVRIDIDYETACNAVERNT